jgi:hypothetical protein
LIVWHENESDEQKPLTTEFSFRYGNKNGQYEKDIAERKLSGVRASAAEVDALAGYKIQNKYSLGLRLEPKMPKKDLTD